MDIDQGRQLITDVSHSIELASSIIVFLKGGGPPFAWRAKYNRFFEAIRRSSLNREGIDVA